MTSAPCLALDVGGANLKAAHSEGPLRSHAFALWRDPDGLVDRLRALIAGLPAFRLVAVTMTAELCDCFATKAQGVLHVLDSVAEIAPQEAILVWGIDGRFHDITTARSDPLLAAAANWLALATIAARLVPTPGTALLVDIGSTTTDLIPIVDRVPRPAGRTDTERLRSGELVYAGIRRTPVCALASELTWRGQPTGLAAELFATTLDVYLIRREIEEAVDDLDTADRRPATRLAARDRLARMVGADRDTFSEVDAVELAESADAALIARLQRAAMRALGPIPGTHAILVSGSGEFLARRLAGSLPTPDGSVLAVSDHWGPDGANAACARALLDLVSEDVL